MTQHLITSYINPDADGVAAAIGMQYLRAQQGETWRVVLIGTPNPDAALGLKHFPHDVQFISADDLSHLHNATTIILTDVHDIELLPPQFPGNKVTLIVDHHPYGTPEAFPHAEIDNQTVGAAATLVAERILAAGLTPPPHIAGWLAWAIFRNTLGLMAQSTTPRDHAQFAAMCGHAEMTAADCLAMAKSLSLMHIDTYKLLDGDITIKTVNGQRLAMAQVEDYGASGLLLRDDFQRTCTLLVAHYDLPFLVINIIDLERGITIISATSNAVMQLISTQLSQPIKDGVVTLPGIVQRTSYLSKPNTLEAFAQLAQRNKD